MANTSSAKKAHAASVRKAVFNLRRKRAMKSAVKEVRELVSAKKKGEAEKLLPAAYKALDKAAKRGVIKANTAARNKARLTKAVNSL